MYTRTKKKKIEYRVKNSDEWQCLTNDFNIKPDFCGEINH